MELQNDIKVPNSQLEKVISAKFDDLESKI